MVICKYVRLGHAAYMPHVDTIRFFGMAVRRAGINIRFSEGFNPHMQLFFAGPPPVGMESECEYMVADCDLSAECFMKRMNATLPDALCIVKAGNVEKCNVAAIANAAAYEIILKGGNAERAVDGILQRKELVIEYTVKGKPVQKEVRSLIYDLKAADNKIYAVLSYGNSNLRAERLAKNLLKISSQPVYDMDILKKMMYNYTNAGLTDLDSILFGKG